MIRVGMPPQAPPEAAGMNPEMPAAGAPPALDALAAMPKQEEAVSKPGMLKLPKYDIEKVDPEVSRYKGPEEGPFQCQHCEFFEGENSCHLVSGPIDPEGVCNLFTTKGGDNPDEEAIEAPEATEEPTEAPAEPMEA